MLLAFVLVFASCKKEEEEVVVSNEFTYDGATLALKKGFHENYGGWYQSIYLVIDDITFSDEYYSYSSESDGIQINFNLSSESGYQFNGTYPFTIQVDEELYNIVRSVELIIDGETIRTTDEDTGSVVVTVSGDVYEINGTFTVEGKSLKVYYKGTLTYADLFQPGK